MNFMIDQRIKYKEKEWRISGIGRLGRQITGIWIERFETHNGEKEKIELYIRKKNLKDVSVI